jgi:hypothetical protein
LLANGHPEAYDYPLGLLWDEAALVIDRVNALEVTRATLVKLAISAALTKEGGKAFRKVASDLGEPTGVVDGAEGR